MIVYIYICIGSSTKTDVAEKKRILHACHSDPTSGHLGIKKTIRRIRERYCWKGGKLQPWFVSNIYLRIRCMYVIAPVFFRFLPVIYASEALRSCLLVIQNFISTCSFHLGTCRNRFYWTYIPNVSIRIQVHFNFDRLFF